MKNRKRDKYLATKRLCKAILKEAIGAGYADLWDVSWNKDYTIKVGLTIAELRLAASLIGFSPTKSQLLDADEVREWEQYVEELDGVE